mmetsp:Transcript_9269/g.20022  ORF Transcript_9269/g.20022 Transcript_9269/m.20022 type:complete len:418 (-) Transcript_9269:197-1450(-)|eukprot:CAMPEP_0168818476 /NCGR_PEP_ID=MMETSP0726-20121227/7776_1 /TAXON_ID=265536 /ORGANISM="Amphiprora sp., Strain CCMP467" /LENGTH=417 /DNA_ID=CAMNT_0008870803 /DNA_START=64 /DNA_END=1317 /DNA_ORIENTATION=-
MLRAKVVVVFIAVLLLAYTAAASEESPIVSTLSSSANNFQVLLQEDAKSQVLSLNPKRRSRVAVWKSRRKRSKQKGVSRNLFFSKPSKEGTLITFSKPNRDRISSWFWGTDPIEFNHKLVGMTNPYLRVQSNRVKARVAIAGSSTGSESAKSPQPKNLEMIPASRRKLNRDQTLTEVKDASQQDSVESTRWWPRGPWRSTIGEEAGEQRELSWRILCYRKRVGYGTDCYERVKQAALAMEFEQGHKGIISVLPPRVPGDAPPYHRFAIQDGDMFLSEVHSSTAANQNVFPIWPGGGRRLATYTRSGPFRWLSLFAVSPISVVYEIVDQRGGVSAAGDCLYSSTAFATCRGHWLCGEERVSVISRDDEPNSPCDVEILSISKPSSSFMGRLTWPLVGKMQNSFFVKQLEALEQAAGLR